MVRTNVALADTALPKGLVGGPFGSSLVGSDYVASGVPVIRGTNLNNGRKLGGDFVFVSDEKVSSDLHRNIAEPGDLVFTQRGTLGQVALVPRGQYERYVVSQSQMRLRADPDIASSDYLFYACSTLEFLKQISDYAISTGVPHINLGILSQLKVPLPGLVEQRAIAEVLGALDDKIAANARLAETARTLACLKLAQRTPTVALAEVVTHHKRSLNPLTLEAHRVAHFSLPAFDATGRPEVVPPSDIKSSKFVVDRPCVLVSKLNPRFPRIWDVQDVPGEPALASTEFLVLESQHSSSSVLWAILSQLSFSAALESKVAGTSGSHQRVRPDDLLGTEVLDPRELSEVVHEQLTSLGRRAAAATDESAMLAAVRDALLPPLMSGKIRVTDAVLDVEAAL